MPSAWRTTTSSSEKPDSKRRLRAHSPPIGRAAISMSTGLSSPGVQRSSAWTGPVSRPSARAAAAAPSASAGLIGRRQPRRRDVDGLLEGRPVERVGLVEQRQHLKGAARQDALQRELRPGDERFDEQLPGRLRDPVGAPPDRRAGARAARSPPRATRRSSARITPRLPDSMSGLTTQGNPTPPGAVTRSATAPGSVPHATAKNRGWRRAGSAAAAAASCSRMSSLFAAAAIAAGAFAGRPSRRAAAAATFAGSSPPTGSTAEIGAAASSAAAISAAAASASLKSMTSESAGQCHDAVEHVTAI